MPTSTKTRSQLKAYFVKNAIPTEGNFADLIDAPLNQSDDGVFKITDQPLAVVAASGEQRRTLQLYSSYPAANPDWLVSLNPRLPGSVATAPGFGIADGTGMTKLMLAPDGSLTVTGNLGYSGRLSKLDTAENAAATVRAADFVLGHSARRGNPGRALVDVGTALVVNFQRDWPSITLDSATTVTGSLRVNGSRIANNTGLGMLETDAADWLRVNPDQAFPAIAMYKPVAIGTGGLSVGDWTQMPQGQLRVTSNASVGGALSVGGLLSLQGGANVAGNAGLLNLIGSDHAYIQYYPDGVGAGRKAWIGFGNANNNGLTVAAEGGDLTLYSATLVRADSGALLNQISVGAQPHGVVPYPYETIQLNPSHNLRIYFGSTQRAFLENTGQFTIYFDRGFWRFQSDGNLVKYRSNNTVAWALNNFMGNNAGW